MEEKDILLLEKSVNRQIMNNVKNLANAIELLKQIHQIETLRGKKGKEIRERFFASHKKSINRLDKEVVLFIKTLLS